MLKDLYKKAMDIVFVNFLWIITNLFGIFITLGASTTALFKVMFQIIRYDEPTSVLKEFTKAFKENFVFSTLVWLGLFVIGVPIYFMYISALSNGNDILLLLAIVGSYQWIIFFIYFFPTLALFKTDKPITMIKNVLIMSNTNIWINLKVLGSLAFVIILVLYVHIAFLVIAIGLYGFMVSFQLRNVFEPHLKQHELTEIEEEDK
jgi:uncharacterized membrane protein YesL